LGVEADGAVAGFAFRVGVFVVGEEIRVGEVVEDVDGGGGQVGFGPAEGDGFAAA